MTSQAAERLDDYVAVAVKGDWGTASSIVLGLIYDGVPFERVVLDLLAPAQREIGERWQRQEATVADEHVLTGMTQRALDAVSTVEVEVVHRGRVLLASAEGDWHSLPTRMFGELLRHRGFDVEVLVGSLPAADVAELLRRREARALVVTCTVPMYFDGVAALTRSAAEVGVPVLAGGRALGADAGRALALGAEAWAPDLESAVAILLGWLSGGAPQVRALPALPVAGVVLLDDVEQLARAAFADLEQRFAGMTDYDERQRRRTLEDLRYIVRFVAASLLVDDPTVLDEFLTWLRVLLGSRGVPGPALDAGLASLAAVMTDHPEARELVTGHLPERVAQTRTGS